MGFGVWGLWDCLQCFFLGGHWGPTVSLRPGGGGGLKGTVCSPFEVDEQHAETAWALAAQTLKP